MAHLGRMSLTSLFLFRFSWRMDLLFKVVEGAPRGDRIIATADNLAVARGVRYCRGAVAGLADRAEAEGAGNPK
jgi:hypothetical protein